MCSYNGKQALQSFCFLLCFFFNDTATTEIYTLSLHDALPICQETLRKLERGEFAVHAHLDLHGMVVEDAERAVDRFLSDSQRRGVRCVLIITGKGYNSVGRSGVLREKIPQWLAKGPSSRRVLAFVTARPCDGGEGALYVLLRRRPGAKSRIDVVTGGVGA